VDLAGVGTTQNAVRVEPDLVATVAAFWSVLSAFVRRNSLKLLTALVLLILAKVEVAGSNPVSRFSFQQLGSFDPRLLPSFTRLS
jgi:hypothetical protein